MKVYVLEISFGGDCEVVGVYTSKEAAENKGKYCTEDEDMWGCVYFVTEMELKTE